MPSRIVTETCPAPECNLTVADIEQFLPELTSYLELFAGSFVHQSQLAWSEVYLHGLLGEAVRKNVEQIALSLGVNVRSLQHLIGQSPWSPTPLRTVHQRLVGETLGEPDGVVLIDESGGAVVQPSICRCAKGGDGGQPAGGSPPLRRSRCAPAPW